MTDKNDVKIALILAAEALIGRKLTESEINELIRAFNKAKGRYYNRALQALEEQSGLSRDQILKEASATTDTDRIMQDLQSTLDNWEDND